MDINLFDIATSATSFANILLTENLKNDNNFSVSTLEQIKKIFLKQSMPMIMQLILQSVLYFHITNN